MEERPYVFSVPARFSGLSTIKIFAARSKRAAGGLDVPLSQTDRQVDEASMGEVKNKACSKSARFGPSQAFARLPWEWNLTP